MSGSASTSTPACSRSAGECQQRGAGLERRGRGENLADSIVIRLREIDASVTIHRDAAYSRQRRLGSRTAVAINHAFGTDTGDHAQFTGGRDAADVAIAANQKISGGVDGQSAGGVDASLRSAHGRRGHHGSACAGSSERGDEAVGCDPSNAVAAPFSDIDRSVCPGRDAHRVTQRRIPRRR